MIKLQIINADGNTVYEDKGIEINFSYEGAFAEGYKIKAIADGIRFLRVKLDELLSECDVFVPDGTFEYVIPSEKALVGGYAEGVFRKKNHTIRICESQNPYEYRNLALNPYDLRGRSKYYPHATAKLCNSR